MNEIEKLYKNAGISKEVIPCPAKYYGYDCTRNNWDDADCSCDIEGYPQFNSEKQIELIKWLSKKGIYIAFVKEYNFSSCEDITGYGSEIFEYGLAGLVNNLWQNLTEEEKGKVKGILEA